MPNNMKGKQKSPYVKCVALAAAPLIVMLALGLLWRFGGETLVEKMDIALLLLYFTALPALCLAVIAPVAARAARLSVCLIAAFAVNIAAFFLPILIKWGKITVDAEGMALCAWYFGLSALYFAACAAIHVLMRRKRRAE